MVRRLACSWLVAIAIVCTPAVARAQPADAFRPPAVPLVTHDPYFSCWSMNDRLTDDWPKHWTGAVHAMCGLIHIDGKPFRYMGPKPDAAPALLEHVRAMRTDFGLAQNT